jgi:hypothetical protein
MDASELFPIIAALLAALLAGVVAWKMRRLPTKALRLSVVGVTSLLALAALLVACALIFFDVNFTRRMPPLAAPDGRHVAITSYLVNTGTGVDEAEVSIRAPWNPYAHRVYTGPAQYTPNAETPEPELHWQDGTHLEIRFHRYVAADGSAAATSGEQGCANSADGVMIACVENRVHALGQAAP